MWFLNLLFEINLKIELDYEYVGDKDKIDIFV